MSSKSEKIDIEQARKCLYEVGSLSVKIGSDAIHIKIAEEKSTETNFFNALFATPSSLKSKVNNNCKRFIIN